MLKYVDYNIVFQEIPGETTLAVNISNCPNYCIDCHSPELREDIGTILDETELNKLYKRYGGLITCICFMGGDSSPERVEELAMYVGKLSGGGIKTAWYSGNNMFPESCTPKSFNYIKLGEYIRERGGLNSPSTNQRMYQIEQGEFRDITHLFLKKLR